jgi:hypothetical protein
LEGAGVYAVSSTISGCTISNNWTQRAGGGAYVDGCEVDRCIIVGNVSGYHFGPAGRGGGVFATNSVIRNSLIAGNRAHPGSGSAGDGTVPGLGGGVYLRGGSLLNCTLTGNQATHAGGIDVESGIVRNSIIYFNTASANANWYNGPFDDPALTFRYCCTTPNPGRTPPPPWVRNIVADPQFVDQTNGNYRLARTSPCYGAGVNESWMDGATDLDGNPRIFDGTVDIGAWESTNRPPVMPVVTWVGPTNESGFPAGSDIRMTARATDSDGSVRFVEFFANSTNLGQAVSATDVYEFVWSNAPSGTFRLHAEVVDNEGVRGTSDPGFPETAVLIAVGAAQPAARLSNPSPDGNDAFGSSVAISGTYLVVGTDVHNPGAVESGGAAYVYDLTSATTTTPAVTLTNPGPGIDVFGWSVAVSGTYVVVGAPFDHTEPDATGTAYGSAYVYDLAGATPTVPVATLTNPTPEMSDVFGWSVGISGTLVVVGTPNDGTGAQRAGSAYVYDMASAMPTLPVATLNNPSPNPGAGFGRYVAMAGTRVALTGAGKVYVYEIISTPPLPVAIPSLVATLTNENGFGSSVAISGTRVVVGDASSQGGPGPQPPPEAGSVYVFDLATATPTEPVARLDNPDPTVPGSDFFASSVGISGTRVVVGAYAHERATRAGSAYVYDLASATPTAPVVTLNNPYPAMNDDFGRDVAVSGARVLVGAPRDDTSGFDAGSAYLYDFSSGTIANPPLVQFVQPQANNGFLRSIIRNLPEQGMLIVERSTDLVEWQPIQTNTIAGDTFALAEPINPNSPHQFFRALITY